jgi:hypothetical protein
MCVSAPYFTKPFFPTGKVGNLAEMRQYTTAKIGRLFTPFVKRKTKKKLKLCGESSLPA